MDPSELWLWYRRADGSGRAVVADAFGRRESRLDPGSFNRIGPGDLRDALLASGRTQMFDVTGESSPLGGYAQLGHDQVPAPGLRAEALRPLAQLPGLQYTGRVRDRAGRTGAAFSLDFDARTGPVRDTAIVDAATGELLGFERTLLALRDPRFLEELTPGWAPLRVRTPAVVAYTVFLEAALRGNDS
ncbi:hypothetical protein [Dactylosporangium matsuzakiense]|uniref:Uncharacterized protein n=1 Tax=Dactylosporangium matsuzakiense TaxID=53360 RepID=A0A9W6NSU4_9ACTN|nr:hypothetical protein [Dactylosporangium matsuzakiense]UWZ47700.1 hypothetical protein Dmats_15615 [Dactylosporangium matsuzakiense]GLL07828.1 hypothetical protein GCM10017581_095860 [Dactylosporangium matsuzakiense]